MTAVQVGTGVPVLPVPRAPADDLPVGRGPVRAAPVRSRAGESERVVHQLVRRELRLLAELVSWAPPAEPARTRALTGHADLLSRLLLAHHRLERDALWPALLRAVPARDEAELRAAVAGWTVTAARIDAQVRSLSTTGRQWAVTGTATARDVLARDCRRLADAVEAHTAEEERVLLPLLDAHLGAAEERIVTAAPFRMTGRERSLVLGLALEDISEGDRARVLQALPRRRRWAWRLSGARRYRAAVVRLRGAPPAA
jgi:hypothetical protein